MKLEALKNWDSADHGEIEYDIFLAYVSGEPRSREYPRNFDARCMNKIAITSGAPLLEDVVYFQERDFVCIQAEHLIGALKSSISSLVLVTNILVDITCMPRDLMAEILACVLNLSNSSKVNLRINYTIAKFSAPPSDIRANESIEAVHSVFSGWSSADSKPTSLVLGLGYEPFKAEGASEFFEPYEQWVFIPESPVLEYLPKVVMNNGELISRVALERKTVNYRVDDPETTFGQLEQVVSALTETTNPVLMPFGPKIFFFLCLVQSMSHPEVGVWQVTDDYEPSNADTEASEYSFGIDCIFSTSC